MPTLSPDAYVALLRGINVGGKNLVPMKTLAGIFAGAGGRDVQTYIQSGNVIFRAPKTVAARLAAAVRDEIEAQLKLKVPVIFRSQAELASVAKGNPWVAAGKPPEGLHVFFLDDEPAAAEVARLDPDRSPPDEFQVKGREIYLCCPEGIGRSKLTTGYFDSKLKTVSTTRNWRTVLKLLELISSAV